MQLHKIAVVLGICALSSPVWAQSSTGSVTGSATAATGVNETNGASRAGVGPQGSGAAGMNTNRPGSSNRATGAERADQRRSDRAVERSRAPDTSGRGGLTGTTTGAANGTITDTTAAVGSTAGAGVNAGTGIGVGAGIGGLNAGANAGAGAKARGSNGGNPAGASGTH